MAKRGPALHAGLRQLLGLLADALRADDRPLAAPPARRRRRADPQPHRARRPAPRPAAGAPDAALAAARRGLRHRAGRQVAPRLPAAFRAAEERLPGVLRLALGRASTTSRTATRAACTTCSRARQEVHRKGYLTDLITERAVAFIKRKRKQPFLLSVHYNAPHWPWETRADEAEVEAHREDLPLRRRLGRRPTSP